MLSYNFKGLNIQITSFAQILATACQKCAFIWTLSCNFNARQILGNCLHVVNSPVSHSARHQRPARERQKIRIASRENVDNQTPRNRPTDFTH